jgi:hypothetical protein
MQDNKDSSRTVITLVRAELAPSPIPDLQRRGQVLALVSLVLLLLVSAALLWNSSHLVTRFESRLTPASGHDKIKLYGEQLASLQQRMAGFIAESVEDRLRKLEGRVAAGTVGAAEIQAFEDLRNELKLLESYAQGRELRQAELDRSDHPRYQMSPGSSVKSAESDLLGEVVELKNLTYFSIASCGFAAFLVSGYWWQQHARLKRLASDLGHRPLLPRSPTGPRDS